MGSWRVLDGFLLYFPYIYYDITMWLLCDYYVIHISCLSLRYSFDNPSECIGVVSGIMSMIYTLSCILYVLSENTFSVPSKSSQKSILTSFLPENQYVILNYIGVGNVVLSVWNRQNRQNWHMHIVFSGAKSEEIKSRRRLNLRLGCQTKTPITKLWAWSEPVYYMNSYATL